MFISISKNKLLGAVGFLSFAFTLVAISGGSASAATKTWTGATDDEWSTGTNWSPSGAPVDGDDLVFDLDDVGLETTNDIASLTVNSITITGESSNPGATSINFAEPTVISGNIENSGDEVNIEGGFTLGSDVSIIGNIVALTPFVSVNAQNTVDVTGFKLTISTDDLFVVQIPIEGNGDVEYNTNTDIEVNGTYSGTTMIAGGRLSNTSPATLAGMFGSSSVVVGSNGSLFLRPSDSDETFDNVITFNGYDNVSDILADQLIVSDTSGAYSGTVAITGIVLAGNARFAAYDGVIVDLEGVDTNGFCIQYGGDSNANEDQFLNGPTGCVVAGAPDTGSEQLTSNPLLVIATTLIAVIAIIFVARRFSKSS